MNHAWAYKEYQWTDLSPNAQRVIESIELSLLSLRSDVRKITESELDADTIKKIFGAA